MARKTSEVWLAMLLTITRHYKDLHLSKTLLNEE